jgi:hypothetical protein
MPSQWKALRLELKYCEECGALWLRITGDGARYCQRCEQLMGVLPARVMDNRRKAGSGRPRRKSRRGTQTRREAGRCGVFTWNTMDSATESANGGCERRPM